MAQKAKPAASPKRGGAGRGAKSGSSVKKSNAAVKGSATRRTGAPRGNQAGPACPRRPFAGDHACEIAAEEAAIARRRAGGHVTAAEPAWNFPTRRASLPGTHHTAAGARPAEGEPGMIRAAVIPPALPAGPAPGLTP